jgi:hypothetical protein
MTTKKTFTIPQLIEYGTLAEMTQIHIPGHDPNPPAHGARDCAGETCKLGPGTDFLPTGSGS